jgi:hypothetical protein
MPLPNLQVTTGLSDRKVRSCNITGYVASAVSFIALEYWRRGLANTLLKNGFVSVPNTSLYARAIAGQSLSYADLPSHIFLAFLALLLGFAAYSAMVVMTKLVCGTGHLRDPVMLMLTFAILSAIVSWTFHESPSPETLTLDLQTGTISHDGDAILSFGAITGFSSYQEGSGKSSHQELGAILSSGQTQDLMAMPDDSNAESAWAARTMVNFLTSHGQTLPSY